MSCLLVILVTIACEQAARPRMVGGPRSRVSLLLPVTRDFSRYPPNGQLARKLLQGCCR